MNRRRLPWALPSTLRHLAPILVVAAGPLPIKNGAVGIQPTANQELKGAVSCVISAWNAYDPDASRKCYADAAVAIWNHESKPIDWDFERRLRLFDSGVRSRFRFKINEARHSRRYTVRGGRVVEEELLEGDRAFGTAVQELGKWGRERKPEGWSSVTDEKGNIRFDGSTAAALIGLAHDWFRWRTSAAH